MYLVGSSSAPFQTMGPSSAGASLSGDEKAETMLCKLSLEDLGLSAGDDGMMAVDHLGYEGLQGSGGGGGGGEVLGEDTVIEFALTTLCSSARL